MNFFSFGAAKKKDLEDRERILKEFKQAYPNAKSRSNDDSSFEILFQSNQQYYTLKIIIPVDFPNARPVIYVDNKSFVHPWLDSNKIVAGCSSVRFID